MKQRHFLWIVLVSLVVYWFYLHEEGNGHAAGLVGKEAPEISLKDGKGKLTKLSDLKGKVVLVHFWATWCPPCAAELPALDALQAALPADKFELLAISVDENGAKDVEPFRKKIPFSFPVIYDNDSAHPVSDVYGTFRLPESYLVDKTGKVVKKYSGPQEWKSAAVQGEIKKLF